MRLFRVNYNSDSFDEQMASLLADIEGSPGPRRLSEAQKPRKVLAVDDKTVILRTYEMYFKHEPLLQDHKLILCSNPEEVAAILEEKEPDLLILDWMMPGISGLELLKSLRSQKRWEKLPVIMATSVGERNKIMECAKYQISGYMVKPIQKKDFARRVSDVLKGLPS